MVLPRTSRRVLGVSPWPLVLCGGMHHYRVIVAYKGTNFAGWQAQSSTPERDGARSIQGTIRDALRKIARYQDCRVTGVSRTDAGVHAQGQLARLSLPRDIDASTLQRGLNSMLPSSIRIMNCQSCEEGFNPKTVATEKEYWYWFSNAEVLPPLLSDAVCHLAGALDFAAMKRAAATFEGTHDFSCFHQKGRARKDAAKGEQALEQERGFDSRRTVVEVRLCEGDALVYGEPVHRLIVRGPGFLKHMVRYMAGAIFAAGRNELSAEQIRDALHTGKGEKLTAKAPACGLHLQCIHVLE